MALVLAGIDEAGYGPLLGPLCVGMAVFRVREWTPGSAAPNLWKLLKAGVSDAPCKRGRVAVNDSKKLKLANDGKRHPLTHLERGVLAHLACLDHRPGDDAAFFRALEVSLSGGPWYAGEAMACPVAHDAASIQIAANMLAGALAGAGVEVLAVRCAALSEGAFNEVVRERGSKAAATAVGIARHLREVWERWAVVDEAVESAAMSPRVVCDRQGGRIEYGEYLRELIPATAGAGGSVRTIEEAPACSRYELAGRGEDGQPRRMHVLFQPEAEGAHLAVGLASMTAKLVRERLMARFNRYWAQQSAQRGVAELKPTAGYRNDAERWLRDAGAVLTAGERRALVRIA